MTAQQSKVIAERRARIRQDAPCEGCGATLAACVAQRGKDPTAPEWFGCCARGLGMAPCRHRPRRAALDGLLAEAEAGHVRTVAEAESEDRERDRRRPRRPPGPTLRELFEQDKVWRVKDGTLVQVADMDPQHRANTARFLLRRAAGYADRIGFIELGLMEGAPEDVVDSWLRADAARLADPDRWIRSTALYRALTDGLGEEAPQ